MENQLPLWILFIWALVNLFAVGFGIYSLVNNNKTKKEIDKINIRREELQKRINELTNN